MGESKKSKLTSHRLMEQCERELRKSGRYWHDQQIIDEAHDHWDDWYGVGSKDYIVYAFTDPRKPGPYVYGPLKFNHEPKYIGYGSAYNRVRESKGFGRQLDRFYDKVAWFRELKEAGYDEPKWTIINHFYTSQKAKLVERKILNLIGRPPLTNAQFSHCEVPLRKEDYINDDEILIA